MKGNSSILQSDVITKIQIVTKIRISLKLLTCWCHYICFYKDISLISINCIFIEFMSIMFISEWYFRSLVFYFWFLVMEGPHVLQTRPVPHIYHGWQNAGVVTADNMLSICLYAQQTIGFILQFCLECFVEPSDHN